MGRPSCYRKDRIQQNKFCTHCLSDQTQCRANSADAQSIAVSDDRKTASVAQLICEAIHCSKNLAMQEWTDAFITNAQQELVGMVKDWKYDYGADDKACSAMLLWMVLKLNPEAAIDATLLQPFDQ